VTWIADEIILRATPPALAALKVSGLAPFAYHVKSLAGHSWFEERARHDLPEGGLLVIRDLHASSSHGDEAHDEARQDWSHLSFDAGTERLLDSNLVRDLAECLEDAQAPPPQLRRALATLAKQLCEPVLYYRCEMFGGEIDYEYSLVYSPRESLLVSEQGHGPGAVVGKDALRLGLFQIGLILPTSYFALHTRSFPWHDCRLQSGV
jgi:hypothetical protein